MKVAAASAWIPAFVLALVPLSCSSSSDGPSGTTDVLPELPGDTAPSDVGLDVPGPELDADTTEGDGGKDTVLPDVADDGAVPDLVETLDLEEDPCMRVTCVASDECHKAGVCDPSTGACSNPNEADGKICTTGACEEGQCVDLCEDVDCGAPPECSIALCDSHTGMCHLLSLGNGLFCSAGACQDGECVDQCTEVVCLASDECHTVGTCNVHTGECSEPLADDGTACSTGACLEGECVDLCTDVTCMALDECHVAGTCDVHAGVCSDPFAEDGTPCQMGSCTDGVCTGPCTGVVCQPLDDCHEAGVCAPPGFVCTNPLAPNGTPCAWGVCGEGFCIGLRDGVFQSIYYWIPWGFASITPSSLGNGNPGSGHMPGGDSSTLTQTIRVLPKTLRLKAGFDVSGQCSPLDHMECMLWSAYPSLVIAGQMAIRAYPSSSGTWQTWSSCLGESAYGESVVYSLEDTGHDDGAWMIEFDNAWLHVVDEQTCPAIGTVLNGNMEGVFGWSPCSPGSGVVTYGQEGQEHYVRVAGTGACGEITCLANWISVPLESTMPHPAFKFAYRSGGKTSGGYDFIAHTVTGALEALRYDAATWTEVTVCAPTQLQGIAQELRFSRGACWAADPDWIELKNVRLEEDAVACP